MEKTVDRLQRLLFLLKCLFLFPFFGKANVVERNPDKIIVVPSGKLGDIVCCTPVFRAIREYLPNTHIIAMGAIKILRPILSDSGLVDSYINIEEKGVGVKAKSAGAQVAIVTGPSFHPSALLYTAGIPLVIAPKIKGGYSPFETRPYQILQRLIRTFPYRMGEYAPRERLNSLEVLGIISNDTTKHLRYSIDAEQKIAELLKDYGINKGDFIVGITPTAGNKIKEWPEGRFAEVADHLIKKHNARVLLIGGPNDEEKVQNVLRNMKNAEAAINVQGKLNIDELKALIAKLGLFISVDTGPIYIAEAFSIPTVNIIGPMNENEQPPRGFIHRNVLPPERESPQLSVLNARVYDIKEALRQVASTTSRAVISELDGLIQDLRKKRDM